MKTPLKQDELNLTKEQIDKMSQKDWDNLPIVTGPKPGDDTSIAGTIKLSDEDLTSTKNVSPNYRDDLPKLEAYKIPTWIKAAGYISPAIPRIAHKVMNYKPFGRSYDYDHEKETDRATGFKQQEDAATAADSTFIRRHHPVFTTTFHAGASEEIKDLQDAGVNLWPGWKEDIIQSHKIKGEKAVKLAEKKNIDVPAWKQELDN